MRRCLLCAVVFLSLLSSSSPVSAMISGGEGNSPIRDPGWARGAAQVFNVESRVAYWEGPPFGGGRYTAECRGDTAAFNAALADFAKIEVPEKKLFVHDGIGASFWLNPNGNEEKRSAAVIDWTFSVWIPASFKRLQRMPAELRSAKASSHPVMHLYAGGNVKWTDVRVPNGVEVVDERLRAHGFETTDGTVLVGRITDLESNQPLPGTTTLQRITPRKTGGYDYEDVSSVNSTDGSWEIKSAPEGWFRVVVSAPGYAPRIARNIKVKPGPLWIPINAALAKPAKIEGLVTGPDGNPLSDVSVRLSNFTTESGSRYETTAADTVTTNADGKFAFLHHPQGSTRVRVHKEGYCRPGLGLEVTSPASDLKLNMVPSCSVEVRVEFGDLERPKGYIVEIEPEGGSVRGSWGGSANIDAADEFTFKHVPPGVYVLKGRPNPGRPAQETDLHTIHLKGGQNETIVLHAKSGK